MNNPGRWAIIRRMPHRVGILLSGSGLYDGSEVQEAVLTILALDRAGSRVEVIAPDRPQLDVVDHASSQVVEGDVRNVLSESCRIARGRVTAADQARPEALDALFLPGGYGAAKNWMSGFATPGSPREPHPEIRALVGHFLERRKPVGVVSLAEALIAAMLGEPLGEETLSMPASEVRVDDRRNIVYTPGFLGGGRISDVAAGIDKMVAEVLARAGGIAGRPGAAEEAPAGLEEGDPR